MQKGIANCRK